MFSLFLKCREIYICKVETIQQICLINTKFNRISHANKPLQTCFAGQNTLNTTWNVKAIKMATNGLRMFPEDFSGKIYSFRTSTIPAVAALGESICHRLRSSRSIQRNEIGNRKKI